MDTEARYEVTINESTNRFEVELGDDTAFIDFRWNHQTLILLYIFVPTTNRGKGISNVLIQYALAYARSKDVKVKVFCHYISRYIRMHPEYQELLEK